MPQAMRPARSAARTAASRAPEAAPGFAYPNPNIPER